MAKSSNFPPKREHFLKSFHKELKKRDIIKAIIAFIGGGWLIVEFDFIANVVNEIHVIHFDKRVNYLRG